MAFSSRALELAKAARLGEASLMLGFPAAGAVLGARELGWAPALALAVTMLGALPLSLSAYAFNTAAGFRGPDRLDPKFEKNPLHVGRIRQATLYLVSGLSALAGIAVFLVWRPDVAGVVAAIWLCWIAYGHPKVVKPVPLGGTLLHLLVGRWMFLVPYMLQGSLDRRGAWLATVFGLALAAGHANHEAMDYEADKRARIKTLAVRFGPGTSLLMGATLASAGSLTALAGWGWGIVEPEVGIPLAVASTVLAVLLARAARFSVDRAFLVHNRSLYRIVFACGAFIATAAHLVGIARA